VKIRRRARIVALQTLFEIDSVNHDVDVVLEHRLEDTPLPDAGVEFTRNLIAGVLENKTTLDGFIQRNAPQWPVEQMATIDRNVLRIAMYELFIDRTTPIKVAINEAVELAKMFGGESSHRFVNGVLGTFVTQMQTSGQLAGKPSPGKQEVSPRPGDAA
jgi:N utilization substance protein B